MWGVAGRTTVIGCPATISPPRSTTASPQGDRLDKNLAEPVGLSEHERYTITRNGRPAVVMVSADEWESIEETLYWLSQPGIHETVAEARSDIEAGRTLDEQQVREALDLGRRA